MQLCQQLSRQYYLQLQIEILTLAWFGQYDDTCLAPEGQPVGSVIKIFCISKTRYSTEKYASFCRNVKIQIIPHFSQTLKIKFELQNSYKFYPYTKNGVYI